MEAPPVGALIRHIRGKENLPLRPGDMFIGNDPFIGALHQNDVQMAAPIYHDGEVIAWAGVMAHETDMGGMDFASWSPKAREVYQEGIRIPAVKLVDQGEIREDVLEFILAASRLPHALGLDIRAFIATLNVAADRLTTLVARYGIAVIRRAMERMIDVSEARTRERLAELPDAVVHVANFLEHDGHENRLYKIDLVMSKRGDTLRLEPAGTWLHQHHASGPPRGRHQRAPPDAGLRHPLERGPAAAGGDRRPRRLGVHRTAPRAGRGGHGRSHLDDWQRGQRRPQQAVQLQPEVRVTRASRE
jgi:N-methylhydantoinase B/oxoprolinase/acetone carboxylase alpha subunit